jgi:hypothetical protein
MAASFAGDQMSLQPSRRLGRNQLLQIVLEAARGNVGLLDLPLPSCTQPSADEAGHRLTHRNLLEDPTGEARTRFQIPQVPQVREEEPPSLHFLLTCRTGGKVLPYLGFLSRRKPLVQELLDLLRGQMPHVGVTVHSRSLLMVRC